MPSDPFDLLAAENPLPALLPGLPLETIRERLGHEPPVAHGQKRIPRLPPTASGILVMISVGVVVIAVSVPILLAGRDHAAHSQAQHAPTGPPGLPPPQELRYIAAASVKAENAPESPCRRDLAYLPSTTNSTPGPALLSTVGVLNRPRTRQDRLPVMLQGWSGGAIYIDYVRRARVTDGVSYYVVPVTAMLFGAERRSPACYRAITAALKAELPQIPARLRAPTLAFERRSATYWLRLEREDTHPGVCLLQSSAQAQAAFCGDTVDQLKRLGLISTPGVLAGIVPDGVHSVTVKYPSVNGKPAQTATSTVVGNVFVTQIQRGCAFTRTRTPRPAMIWRSANGRIIKKIPSLGPFSGLQTAALTISFKRVRCS